MKEDTKQNGNGEPETVGFIREASEFGPFPAALEKCVRIMPFSTKDEAVKYIQGAMNALTAVHALLHG